MGWAIFCGVVVVATALSEGKSAGAFFGALITVPLMGIGGYIVLKWLGVPL